MRRIPLIAAGIAIAGGVSLALALPAGAAVSQASPPVAAIQVQSPGVLEARGAAVMVPVLVVCSPGDTAYPSLHLTQRVGSGIASGSGSTQLACTGNLQTVNITVPANADGEAFRKGTASAIAQMYVCNYYTCNSTTDTRTIELTNKS
jgi:hypothetical protein